MYYVLVAKILIKKKEKKAAFRGTLGEALTAMPLVPTQLMI